MNFEGGAEGAGTKMGWLGWWGGGREFCDWNLVFNSESFEQVSFLILTSLRYYICAFNITRAV